MVSHTFFSRASASSHQFYINALNEEIHDPNARFIVVEETSTSPPTLFSFAKWIIPMRSDTPRAALPEDWPIDGHPALANMCDVRKSIIANRPHWYLEIVVTEQEHQGRGAGAIITKWRVDRADEDGVECYLDATPEARPLYERFGFRN